MDVEKVKLIVKNMELLISSLKQEIESAPTHVIEDEDTRITPLPEDYDEVF